MMSKKKAEQRETKGTHFLRAPEAPRGEDGNVKPWSKRRLDGVARDVVLVRHHELFRAAFYCFL